MKTTNYLPHTPMEILSALAFAFAAYLMFNA